MSATPPQVPNMALQHEQQHHQQHYPGYPENSGFPSQSLLQQLKSQLEFYFTPQNLERDVFLQSQLSATNHLGAVDIGIICNFPRVKQLHALIRGMPYLPANMTPPADPRMILFAIQDSTVVCASDDGCWLSPVAPFQIPFTTSTMTTTTTTTTASTPLPAAEQALTKDTAATVATTATTVASPPSSPSSQASGSSSLEEPTHPHSSQNNTRERTTIIIRDLPPTVTTEQVLDVFTIPEKDISPKSARAEIGQTWYVTFESEEQAVEALNTTRGSTIGGASIQARLKSETPPNMPLPPSALEADANSQSNHGSLATSSLHPNQYVSIPTHPATMQPGSAYGFVPYGAAAPSFPPQQPPHFFAGYPKYQNQQRQPPYVYAPQSRQGLRYGDSTTPPPHVYVKGQSGPQSTGNRDKLSHTQHLQTQKSSKKNKKKKRAKKQSQAQNGSSPTNQQDNQATNSKKQQGQSKNSQADVVQLSEANFPTLGNSKATAASATPVTIGYAQALLKSAASRATTAATEEAPNESLEKAVQQMAVSGSKASNV